MEATSVWHTLRWAWRVSSWCMRTAWQGAVMLWRLGRLLRRWPEISGPVLHCPHGHEIAGEGTWQCRCSAVYTGWVFEECPNCRATAGWVACDVCGMAIINPLRE